MFKIKKNSWVIDSILKAKFSTRVQIIKNFLWAKKKYLPKDKNADMGDILKCALCPNMCRFDCPISLAEKSEAGTPAGKAKTAYMIETGKLDTDDARDLMYLGLGCDACRQWCPFGFSVGDLLIGVKKDIADRGLAPKHIAEFAERTKKEHSIYEGNASLGESKKADVVYFAGCTALNKRKEVVDSTKQILEEAGINFTTLADEWCCGAPLHALGFENYFKEFADHNLEAFSETGCETIVCSCPECAYTFRGLYPKFKVKHISQFLGELIKEKKLGDLELEGEFVFHDPCVLARKLNSQEPKQILNRISKLNFKEPHLSGKDTRCCGRGSMLNVTHPDISFAIAKNRVSELKEISDHVISACPSCEVALKEADKDISVSDLSEVVLRGMKGGRR